MSDEMRASGSGSNTGSRGQPISPAQNFLKRYGLLLGVAAIVLLADQISKRIVEAQIPFYTEIPLIGEILSFTHTQNTGAAFSLFQNGGLFFIVVAIVVSGLIIYYVPRLPANDWLARIALGMQLGGAIGNLIDRLRQGYVTDFIHFQIPAIGFDWPVSNVADICIVVGVLLLILDTFLRERQAQ